jgi:hypothetical protein
MWNMAAAVSLGCVTIEVVDSGHHIDRNHFRASIQFHEKDLAKGDTVKGVCE